MNKITVEEMRNKIYDGFELAKNGNKTLTLHIEGENVFYLSKQENIMSSIRTHESITQAVDYYNSLK